MYPFIGSSILMEYLLWRYKCSCGHIYAVGECGMARQSSRCPECRAAIGSGSGNVAASNMMITQAIYLFFDAYLSWNFDY